jgi:hypothetical protein
MGLILDGHFSIMPTLLYGYKFRPVGLGMAKHREQADDTDLYPRMMCTTCNVQTK